MIKICLSALLWLCSAAAFGQDMMIPGPIQAPKSTKLILQVYARGVQMYVCTQDVNDTSRYIWVFTGPRAVLYSDAGYTQVVGKHYFDASNTPNWEYPDGSKVEAAKLQQVNSPDAAAIPWLLLKAVNTQGTGILKSVTYVQRVQTKGGKAPSKADASQKGKSIEIAYEAEYLFYSN